MKIRVFQGMDNSVFRVTICTGDWSEGDVNLIQEYGEPEINIGGEIPYEFDGEEKTKIFGDMFIRVMHGFPHSMGFDSRDYMIAGDTDANSSIMEAVAVGKAWKDAVLSRLEAAIRELRSHVSPLPTEEVTEI